MKKLYKAIFWKKDENSFGKRVDVWAYDIDEAEFMIIKEYGEDIILSIYNEEDENKIREHKA